MIEAFVGDGYSERYVRSFCVALLHGCVLQAAGFDGRHYSAGPTRTATGESTFTLLSWPHGCEEAAGDAFDVAAAFFAQLAGVEIERLARALGCDVERTGDEAA